MNKPSTDRIRRIKYLIYIGLWWPFYCYGQISTCVINKTDAEIVYFIKKTDKQPKLEIQLGVKGNRDVFFVSNSKPIALNSGSDTLFVGNFLNIMNDISYVEVTKISVLDTLHGKFLLFDEVKHYFKLYYCQVPTSSRKKIMEVDGRFFLKKNYFFRNKKYCLIDLQQCEILE
jgi:hypothetical protein